MTPHIVLDLETVSLAPNAAIVAVGAVEVLLEEGVLGREFYLPVDRGSSERFGLHVDPDTVAWWEAQSEVARDALKCGRPLDYALDMFTDFCRRVEGNGTEKLEMWGNGAAFDNVVLRSAYDAADICAPWGFRKDRCYRTLRALLPHVEFQNVGTHHNALDDAKAQGLHLIKLMRELKGDTSGRFAS